MKMSDLIETTMFAPCGMNCMVCYKHCYHKKPCAGCGDGNIGIQGNGTFRYSSNTIHPATGDNSGGVRPALWLSLEV